MKTVSIHVAKTHLSRLIEEALAGEEIVIARRKDPLVRLVLVKQEKGRRKVGALPDLVRAMPDGFNDSLEDWESGIEPARAK